MPWSERLNTEEGEYIHAGMIAGRASVHLLMRPDSLPDLPQAVVLPVDNQFPFRLKAAEWFWSRFFSGSETAGDVHVLDDHHRNRLILTLRALDGEAAGASQRIIGHAVLGAPLLRAVEWKDHSARSFLQRLFAEGTALVSGGYRRFLLPSHPRS